jgi:hypothetical protein
LNSKTQTALSGALFLAFGAATFYFSLEYKLWDGLQVGSGLFPAGLAIVLGILGIVLIIQAGLTSPTSEREPWTPRPIIALCLSVLVFSLLIHPFGLVIALAAAVVIASFADRPNIKYIIVVYVLALLFVYLFLIHVINLPYKLL